MADPGKNIFETASPWIAAFFIVTMSLNVCCTGVSTRQTYARHLGPDIVPLKVPLLLRFGVLVDMPLQHLTVCLLS